MKRRLPLLIVLTLAILLAPHSASMARAQKNSRRLPSRSLAGATGYLNTSRPIDIRDLRGKIVLLDFWTYCCINCMHILPMLKQLEEKYPNQLVVLGIHSPKFNTEKDIENIRRAVLRYDITHPVINDSNKAIWRRYNINFWPTMILIDPEGYVCGIHRGEAPFNVIAKEVAKQVRLHKQKGTLNETPLRWALELNKQQRTALRFPGKVIVAPTGQRLVIADRGNHRLIVTDPTGRKTTVIGTG